MNSPRGKWGKDMNSHFIEEETWKANKYMKRYTTPSKSGKCKLKPQWDTILYPPYWQKFKSLTVSGVDENVLITSTPLEKQFGII